MGSLGRNRIFHVALAVALSVTGASTLRVVGSVRPAIRALELAAMVAGALLMMLAAFAVTAWEARRRPEARRPQV